jgi:hypothetical protein
MLVLLLVAGALGFSGTFLQLTDLVRFPPLSQTAFLTAGLTQHLDLKYAVGSNIQTTSCHALNGTARALGERWYCDSPEDLIDRTLRFAADHTNPDFVLLTGDFARHDDYPAIPRTWQEVLDENTKVAFKVAKAFPGVPILPSLGNNDCYPHDTMAPPGPNNTVLNGLAQAWAPLLDPQTRQQMLNGGWLSKRLPKGNLLLSLNTLYFAYGPDCNVTGPPLEQLEWLGALLQSATAAGQKVIISGHIPPDMWLPRCRAWYVQTCVANAQTIRGQIFGHKHSDQFNFVNVQGVVNPPQLDPSTTIAITCAPSIVPTYNPAFRLWKYSPDTMDLLGGYKQFYADIDQWYSSGSPGFAPEYSLVDAFNLNGNPSNVDFWIRFKRQLISNSTMCAQYLKYFCVSVASATAPAVCKQTSCQ